MKCPKCDFEMEDGATVCPKCGFSPTINGVPVKPPIVEAPVVPEVVSAPVVEEENKEEETPVVVEAPSVEEPKAEAVVEAPVVDAPVVDAPVVEAPVVDAPKVEEVPVVEAPKVEETKTEEVPVVEAPKVEETLKVETPSATAATESVNVQAPSAPKEKKNILVFIVIGVLALIAIGLVVLLIVNGPNSTGSTVKKEEKSNTNTTVNEPSEKEETQEDTTIDEAGVVTVANVKFSVPSGFEIDNAEDYYQIFNSSLRKIFILEDTLYTGDESILKNEVNLMKSEYANNGFTDVEVETATSNEIVYGIVTYTFEGAPIQELYALLNNKYIVAFYNLQTDLVSKEEFINYSIETAKSGKEIGPVFSDNDEKISFENKTFVAKDNILIKNFE